MTGTVIETFTGSFFDYRTPDPQTVRLEDIARALSQTCRFGGHTRVFFSVAEHALLVRSLVVQAGHPELAFAALHHDSHEAYIGDIPTPLKNLLGDDYRRCVHRADTAIAIALRIPREQFHHPVVREADQTAMWIEARNLKASGGWGPEWGFDGDPPTPPWVLGKTPPQAELAFRGAHSIEAQS